MQRRQQFLELKWEIPTAPVAGIVATNLLPFAIMNWWMGLNSFLGHTHPQIRWYDRSDEWRHAQVRVECTVHLNAPWPLGWLLGNSLEHTAHHVAPKVADTEVSAIQDHLEEALLEFIQKVKLTDCLRILAFCKLYDYSEHRWLDFDGKPMAGAMLPVTQQRQ